MAEKLRSYLKKFLRINNSDAEGDTDVPARNESEDYGSKKSRRFTVLTGIVSFFAAIAIWLVAVTTGSAVGEQIFNIAPEMIGYNSFVSAAEQNGFNVTVETNTTVSFTLEGRKKSISRLTVDDISVYADFSGYTEKLGKLPNDTEQTITVEIVIDAPIYFNVDDVSKKEVTVKLIPINKVTN